MIYVPEKESYKCYVVQNENVIRAYKEVPQYNMTISYRDYYINSDYIYKDSTTNFGSYSTLPVCLDNNIITSDYYYRLDFYKVLITLFIMSFFIIYIPYKVLLHFFRRFRL